jgi:hypothetical protein
MLVRAAGAAEDGAAALETLCATYGLVCPRAPPG